MQNSTQKYTAFPFHTILNLRPLVEFWEQGFGSQDLPFITQQLIDQLNNAPELKQPVLDDTVLKKHEALIRYLMSAIVPPASSHTEMVAAIVPFQNKAFYSTQGFKDALALEELDNQVSINIPGNKMVVGKIMHACLLILNKIHQVNIEFNKPILFTVKNRHTGLDKVYKVEINNRFLEVVAKHPPKPIEPKVIKFLTEKIYDVDLWLQYIRPEDYEFHGFMAMRLIDVTEEEMLSSIKYDLLKKDAVVDRDTFIRIQQKLRSIFNMPDVMLGIVYFDSDNNLILNHGTPNCWKSLTTGEECKACDYAGSIYERSWKEKKLVTVEDLKEYPFKTDAELALINNGINNILLAPMVDNGETIGMLEIASSVPGRLDAFSGSKVENVLPMFTVAVKRVKEEMDTEVRALIQEECTAIHPAVQWRFFKAGRNLLNKKRKGENAAVMEEIVFTNVHPLFGMADVRNSSIERNRAIQHDLQQNLSLAKDLLIKINAVKDLPLIDEMIVKIDTQLAKLHHTLASGDETNLLDFIKSEVTPLIRIFENDVTCKPWIDEYTSFLDPSFQVVYNKRKDFEESLDLINRTLFTTLDKAEETAQQMYPHYFEKYKTDGVEFTLYVGESLVQDKKFDSFFLKNFRLWQLLLMCEVDKKIKALKPQLKSDLEITQLILVHDQPITIRFRADEKRFDVDGAYDIRYEIIKKRIDKAYIKSRNERLTQPGKIAIVYNQAKVAEEYRRYFRYLMDKNLILPTIEDLELEELPGATGLRALRIRLNNAEESVVPSSHQHELDDLLEHTEEVATA